MNIFVEIKISEDWVRGPFWVGTQAAHVHIFFSVKSATFKLFYLYLFIIYFNWS